MGQLQQFKEHYILMAEAGFIAINQADNWLHAGIALLSLYFGLFLKSK